MADVSVWSTVDNDNGTLGGVPTYWPEGQPPSSVNNCARNMMARVRTSFNELPWFNWGYTTARVSGSSFSVVTAAWNTVAIASVFEVGGRVKIQDTLAKIYGTISTVSVSAASTLVTFAPDSSSLTGTAAIVFNSVIAPGNTPLPSGIAGVAAITSDTLDITQDVVTSIVTIDLPDSVSGRNMIVNGDFQIWQRGNGGSATFTLAPPANQYGPDRWQIQNNTTSGNAIFSQQSGPTNGSFRLRLQREAGSTGTGNITACTSLTRDMCIGAAGNAITLSIKAKAGADFSSAGSLMTVQIYTGTGSNDVSLLTTGFTGSANPVSTTQAITTTETTYSFTTPVLASNITQLGALFLYSPTGTAGTNDWCELGDVQLEISPQATAFENLNFNEQLNNCLPFFQKGSDYGAAPQSSGSGDSIQVACSSTSVVNNAYYATIPLYTPMFFNPTITTYPFTTYTNTNRWSNGGGTDYAANSAVVGIQGTKFFSIQNQSGAPIAISVNQLVTGGWKADSELY